MHWKITFLVEEALSSTIFTGRETRKLFTDSSLVRSARDLHNMVHDLEKKDISLIALDQAIDTSTPTGKAFLGMLATFAEFETNIRKERQLEGIAKAKAKGVYKGRKATAQALKPKMLELLEGGLSKPKIAKELGVSTASVYNVLE